MNEYEYKMITAINEWSIRNLFPKGIEGPTRAETYPAMLKRHGEAVFYSDDNLGSANCSRW